MDIFRKLFTIEVSPIDILVQEYVRRVKNGEALEPSDFLAEYPHLAVALGKALSTELARLQPEAPIKHTFQVGQRKDGDIPVKPGSVYGYSGEASYLVGVTVGNYQIESVIGWGAMGKVYRAWDTGNKRRVAFKTLQSGSAVSRLHTKRLEREALAQSKLSHPNIVEIYDVGMLDVTPYLVMEYVENGVSLQTLLDKSAEPFGERRAAEIMIEVARALDYSHQRAVVHRDIKPSNILMAGNTPKLTDFGLAFIVGAELSRLTQSNELLGTLCYMPPEQVDSRRYQDRQEPQPCNDIYAFGATLYELVTGQPPHVGDTAGELINSILQDDPLRSGKPGDRLPRDMEAICIKCLEKNPDQRYASAAELALDLQRFLDGVPVAAPLITWWRRRLRRAINRHAAAIAAVLFAVSLGVFVVWATAQAQYRDRLHELRENQGAQPNPGSEYTLSFLLQAAHDEHPETRMCAITALCRHDSAFAQEALMTATEDSDPGIRFHLATELSKSPNAIAGRVCRKLLQEESGSVGAAAVRLAESLNDLDLIPYVLEKAYGHDKLLRSYALAPLSRLPEPRYSDFISTYLRQGPPAGRMELLERFLNGRAEPLPGALIDVLEHTEVAAERNLLSRILTFYTNADHGYDHGLWRAWWQTYRQRWRARTCLAVTWAPGRHPLQVGDIIWELNDAELPRGTIWPIDEPHRLTVIRGDSVVKVSAPPENYRSRTFYIGAIDGLPTGQNHLVPRIRSAVATIAPRP